MDQLGITHKINYDCKFYYWEIISASVFPQGRANENHCPVTESSCKIYSPYLLVIYTSTKFSMYVHFSHS